MVEAGPLANQSESSTRKRTVDEPAIEGEPVRVTCVTSVEVGRVVISEEHEDGYSVEGADAGHWHLRRFDGSTEPFLGAHDDS